MKSALRASAERRLQWKQYAAALAERRFNKVDSGNRFVAAEPDRGGNTTRNDVGAAAEVHLHG